MFSVHLLDRRKSIESVQKYWAAGETLAGGDLCLQVTFDTLWELLATDDSVIERFYPV